MSLSLNPIHSQNKSCPAKVAEMKEILSKQVVKIAKQAEEHESFITKVTHFMGVFCIRGILLYSGCKWIYYRYKKWHYYLLGPLAWALIVWRCSLVFSSVDKLVSVLIHLLPGVVFFTIRWWDPAFFEAMHPEGTARRASWPYVGDKSLLWTWLFTVPLIAYSLWQALYFLIVNVLRRQRELSKRAQKANNLWWRLSGLLGDQNRLFMYILLQAVVTMVLIVPIFLSYEMHLAFQILKVSATVWNGSYLKSCQDKLFSRKRKNKNQYTPR
ncbi:hypothetical protein L1987_14100 [Smallanthus sonchifolius]|uniref:Uncharacterized protein n=1 Tax=Smallanthus sonchifolius TaxID=185202 RepID=A0ACB9J4F9_9ASTR|nr:hypothetical protein L1987_14100 [Smallanthus sonchifolius]